MVLYNDNNTKVKTIPDLTNEEIDIFWNKVALTANVNTCWEWQAGISRRNYGNFFIKNDKYVASRISYFLFYKKDPLLLCVCHTCDNPKCVNPNHLFLGTSQDNQEDKISKGRHKGRPLGAKMLQEDILLGVQRPNAKLSDEKVKEIRRLHNETTMSSTKIGDIFGVCSQVILNILWGKAWTHVK